MTSKSQGARQFAIGKADVVSILKGAGLAAVGSMGAVLATLSTGNEVDFQSVAILGLATFFSVLGNTIRKFLTDTTGKQ